MGLWSDWYSKYAGKENSLVNAEFVLKKIDEASSNNAPANATLIDGAASDALPITAVSTPITTFLQVIRNNLKWLFNNKANNSDMNNLIKTIYPVGAIYMSVNSTNPSILFAGTTWTVWGKGRVPVGVQESDGSFDTAEKTGGEKEHKLTVAEMPSHNHSDNGHKHTLTSYQNGGSTDCAGATRAAADDNWMTKTSETGYADISYSGSSNSHNNLQPYITCYMFKRTA
jgi:hypothetical protein